MLQHQAPVLPPPGCGRDPLIIAITTFLEKGHLKDLAGIRQILEDEIDRAGPDALFGLTTRLSVACDAWGYYPSDPLARRIHHVLAERVLAREPVLADVAHLSSIADAPVVIVANHLSYADANLLEVVVRRGGFAGLADRLTVVAGPKVYSSLRRRFSSLCFATIRVPQSSAVSSGEAVMRARAVALAARQSIDAARQRLALGAALLIFPEGTRSRSGGMQPFLPGAARYLDRFDGWVLPAGLTGTESLFPMGEEALSAVDITVRFGGPIRSNLLAEAAGGDRRLLVDALGLSIAELLPARYRGGYEPEAGHLADARCALGSARAGGVERSSRSRPA